MLPVLDKPGAAAQRALFIEVASTAYKFGWGLARTSATLLFVVCGKEAAVTRFFKLARDTLFFMTDVEYIRHGKQLHDLMKRARWLDEPLSVPVLAHMRYPHCLAGRGIWPEKSTMRRSQSALKFLGTNVPLMVRPGL
eukprot:5004340-Amphidinium_carterae.1